MFGELNEAVQPKTSLAKYLIEFNYLAVQPRPHRILYLRLLGRPYTILYVSRSVVRPLKTWTQPCDGVFVGAQKNTCSVPLALLFPIYLIYIEGEMVQFKRKLNGQKV